MPITPSPLRYPGGKTQLYPLVCDTIRANNLTDVTYIEPFAGGCGLALKLLFKGDVDHITLNDFDIAIYSFWFSILNFADRFCAMVEEVPVTVEEWHKQKKIYNTRDDSDILLLGFATFFLNRTNISGVIKGGFIGGKDQSGKYKIDARFSKKGLIQRIQRISSHRERISFYNLDAIDFIEKIIPTLTNVFINFDPPYVKKGSSLYKNAYSEHEHRELSQKITSCNFPWIVTYDICPLVKDLYYKFRNSTLGINYSIGDTRSAKEYIFFSDDLIIPQKHFASAI